MYFTGADMDRSCPRNYFTRNRMRLKMQCIGNETRLADCGVGLGFCSCAFLALVVCQPGKKNRYRRLPSNRPPLLKATIWLKHGMGGYLIMQQMNRGRAHLT